MTHSQDSRDWMRHVLAMLVDVHVTATPTVRTITLHNGQQLCDAENH